MNSESGGANGGEPEPDVPDLDAELRRLFADDRLTLPVGRDTEARVIAGVQRRKRRRRALATTGGVLAMATVVLAGAVLSGLVHPTRHISTAAGPPVLSTTVPATTTVPTASSVAPTVEEQDSLDVLGPAGVGKLSLGMSWQAAMASGLLRQSGPVTSAGCLRYTVIVEQYSDSPTAAASVTPPWPEKTQIVVNVRDDIVQLITSPLLHTPEGIGVGSSREDLKDAYPDLTLPTRGGTTLAPVDGNPMAVYVFDLSGSGTVMSLSLRMAKSDCLG